MPVTSSNLVSHSDCETLDTESSKSVPLRRRPLTTDLTAYGNVNGGVGGVGVRRAQQLRPLSLGLPTPTPARRSRGPNDGTRSHSSETPPSSLRLDIEANHGRNGWSQRETENDSFLYRYSSGSSSLSTPTPQTPTVRLERVATVEVEGSEGDGDVDEVSAAPSRDSTPASRIVDDNNGGESRRVSSGSSYGGLSGSEADLGQYNNDDTEGPPPKCSVDHASLLAAQGRQLINTILPGNIDTIFNLFFTNSKFFFDFQASRKSLDVEPTEWEENAETKLKTRTVSLTVSLNQCVGPKHSQLKDTLTLLPESKPGHLYAMNTEAVNSGVPLADKFLVSSHFCLEHITGGSTHFAAIAQIKYREKVWPITKSIIEQKTWEGLTDFYGHLERALKEECLLNPTEVSQHSDFLHDEIAPVEGGHPITQRRKKYRAPPAPGGTVTSRRGSRSADLGLTSMQSVQPTTRTQPSQSWLVGRGFGLSYTKIIVALLAVCLVIQNIALHVKLGQLEASFNSEDQAQKFSVPAYFNSNGIPSTHQEWLGLVQRQEVSHRAEVQKWQGHLLAALELLKKAENDLQSPNQVLGETSPNGPQVVRNVPTANSEPQNRTTV